MDISLWGVGLFVFSSNSNEHETDQQIWGLDYYHIPILDSMFLTTIFKTALTGGYDVHQRVLKCNSKFLILGLEKSVNQPINCTHFLMINFLVLKFLWETNWWLEMGLMPGSQLQPSGLCC